MYKHLNLEMLLIALHNTARVNVSVFMYLFSFELHVHVAILLLLYLFIYLQLLEEGLAQWNWLSMEVPDFLAKLKASLQTDLLPAVQCVLQQTKDIQRITDSWTELVTLDMFRENERSSLELLSVMYR